jgi:hypothetical protein
MMANPFPTVTLNTTIPTTQLLSQFFQFVTFQEPLSWILFVFVFDGLLTIIEAPRSENLIILFRNLAIWDFVIGLLMQTLKYIGWINLPVIFITEYMLVIGLMLAISLIISSFQ